MARTRTLATAIAVDVDGHAFLTGITTSTDFPGAAGSSGGIDAFLTKLDSTGSSLLYSRYIGGSGEDIAYGIAVDSAGNAYVAGTTTSTDFPTASPMQESMRGNRDAFLVKLNASGASYAYSTYLGGSDLDWVYGLGPRSRR